MHGATFKSYNSNTLPTADYTVSFALVDNPQFQVMTTPVLVDRGFRAPAYATQRRSERYFVMTVKVIDTVNIVSLTGDLLNYFDAADDNIYKLIVTDSAARDWYVYAKVTGNVALGNGIHKITFMAPDGIWYSDDTVTYNWNPLTSPDSEVISTVGGTHPARPKFTVTPATLRTGGASYRRFVIVRNQTTRGFPNYPVSLTGTGLDTAALVTAGKMQADGDDLRVQVNGKQKVRYLGGINTTTTKVWINLDLSPKVELVTEGALGAGALTEIEFEATATQRIALRKLPTRGILQIENELFTYTAVDVTNYKVTGVSRAAYWTTAATHVDASTAYWIEHAIVMTYGNSTALSPGYGTAEEPIFSLTSSNNTSWVYASFMQGISADQSIPRRTGSWGGEVIASTGGESGIYTGNRGAQPRLATEMGLFASFFYRGNRAQSERYILAWNIYHPAGVTTVNMDGEKYRGSTQWATKAMIQTSDNGRLWDDSALTIATPASASTWTAWNFNTSLGATYNYVRLLLSGTLAAVSDRTIYVEVENCTLTLDSANTPSVTLNAEQASSYELDFRIRSSTTGEMFSFNYTIKFGQAVEIDCEEKTVTYLENNANVYKGLDVPVQSEWITLVPGSNTLVFTESGLADVDIAVTWRDRDGGF